MPMVMKIVIAPDSFKGSLSANEAATAMTRGVRRVFTEAQCIAIPVADGGEGTIDCILRARPGRRVLGAVHDPRGKRITVAYALLDNGKTAVIETAAASGLHLIEAPHRNPLRTSSYGTGELIRDALDRGVKKIILGTGGSATVDGGTGMAQALGIRFLDRDQHVLRAHATGALLERIATIDLRGCHPRVPETEWIAAVDVTNRLCGRSGAARIYGPQKGATPGMVMRLEKGLRHLGRLFRSDLKTPVFTLTGGGAAGGLAAGLAAFTGARLTPGFDLIAELLSLEERMRGADLVLTGEGRLDGQTLYGKAPAGVAHLAAGLGIPTFAVAGSLGPGYRKAYAQGFVGISSVISSTVSQDEVLLNSAARLTEATERTLRLFRAGMGFRAVSSSFTVKC